MIDRIIRCWMCCLLTILSFASVYGQEPEVAAARSRTLSFKDARLRLGLTLEYGLSGISNDAPDNLLKFSENIEVGTTWGVGMPIDVFDPNSILGISTGITMNWHGFPVSYAGLSDTVQFYHLHIPFMLKARFGPSVKKDKLILFAGISHSQVLGSRSDFYETKPLITNGYQHILFGAGYEYLWSRSSEGEKSSAPRIFFYVRYNHPLSGTYLGFQGDYFKEAFFINPGDLQFQNRSIVANVTLFFKM